MKILVTGAAGFIGYHVSSELAYRGHTVVGVDRDINGSAIRSKRFDLLEEAGVFQREVDITHNCDRIDFSMFDFIFHLAANADVMHSLEQPAGYYMNNIVGTQNIIDGATLHNIPVIYASSSSVYSSNKCSTAKPYKENMVLNPPPNPYAMSKYVNESQFDQASIKSWGMRFFTVYGEWGRPDMALWKFTQQIMNEETVTLRGNGKYIRDFTHIDDLINALILVLDQRPTESIINVGTGRCITNERMVNIIENVTGIKANIEYEKANKYESKMTLADTSILTSLGWESHTGIEVGIKSFVKWYKKAGGRYDA